MPCSAAKSHRSAPGCGLPIRPCGACLKSWWPRSPGWWRQWPMWTPLALASEHRRLGGDAWRVVESQSRYSTMKIVDDVDEQEILEAALEHSKPAIPEACRHLHWLLATPFRYAPYPTGSRFRRARQVDGCLYASERIETAI